MVQLRAIGATAVTVTHPMDLVRIRLQVGSANGVGCLLTPPVNLRACTLTDATRVEGSG